MAFNPSSIRTPNRSYRCEVNTRIGVCDYITDKIEVCNATYNKVGVLVYRFQQPRAQVIDHRNVLATLNQSVDGV
jgi:hypothetical protein